MSGDPPKCWTQKTPKSSKEHRCCECRGTIAIGETCHLFSGIWDSAQSYKTCAECEILRDEVTMTIQDMEDYPAFGELYDYIFGGEHPAWIKRFMDTRRKRNAPESPGRWMEKREATLIPELTT